ncbi:hypothetical protein LTR36_007756 [Oleoguttula mirabilis]|uniref:Metallo-beta-lactamase domain-containing protein n=1 Tax=Oleoguttula mirabilis TaxID=1507867 RepID=A0AAV9JUI4_9PEZI|nr:hypothetical protein LTR36_007756 [Oleoguttula mirabilis]
MALTVEKLNDDTTFLLAFAPPFAPQKATRKFPGAFTILIDPWLAGRSSFLHPAFQVSQHTSDCALHSLADLQEQPDIVIISQDKADHCHKETLCTLPRDTSTCILATPAAAKKIRSWKHFDSSIVHVMKPYNAEKPETVIRISIPAYTSSSSKGQITIANVPTRRDVTGVHNAIGITYRPPGSMLTAFEGELIKLTDMMNPSSTSPKLHKARSAIKLTEAISTPPPTSPNRPRTASSPRPVFLDPLGRAQTLPEPPAHTTTTTTTTTTNGRPASRAHKEKTLSVLYTPHGVSSTTLTPYIDRHLRPTSAGAPLTALFHCLNTEENPWFLGGIVANGAPGGTAIARQLRAQHWIGAHDEAKDLRGVATTWIKSRLYTVGDVEGMLREGRVVGRDAAGTEVHALRVGERMRVEG